ncbi:hypothetical protein ACM7XJ_30145 [Pseudomonas aeruginosa]
MQQNENFAKQDEQAEAEAERPEVFGLERYRVERTGQGFWPYCVRAGDGTRELFVGHLKQCKRVAAQLATAFEDGKFVAGALRAELETERMRLAGCGVAALGYFDGCADAYKSASLSDVLRLRADCDAALARVAELERQEPVATVAKVPGEDWNGLHFYRDLQGMQPGTKLYAAPVAQAQHSVPEEFSFEYRHPNGECHTVTVSREQVINEMPDFLFEALCSKFCNCEPVGETNVVECCCDEYAEEFKLIAAAPGKEVGHE